MTIQLAEATTQLEEMWSDELGFLCRLREGVFDRERGAQLIGTLESVVQDDAVAVPKRVAALLWYLPVFLMWNVERVGELDREAMHQITNSATAHVERLLGVP